MWWLCNINIYAICEVTFFLGLFIDSAWKTSLLDYFFLIFLFCYFVFVFFFIWSFKKNWNKKFDVFVKFYHQRVIFFRCHHSPIKIYFSFPLSRCGSISDANKCNCLSSRIDQQTKPGFRQLVNQAISWVPIDLNNASQNPGDFSLH